jgi:hypothetical protein
MAHQSMYPLNGNKRAQWFAGENAANCAPVCAGSDQFRMRLCCFEARRGKKKAAEAAKKIKNMSLSFW